MAQIALARQDQDHLVLRSAACSLFEDAAFQSGHVVVDFEGIKFASRSFAQEYLACKSRHRHSVTEVNMSEDVERMFRAAGSSKPRAPPLKRTEPIVMKV